MKTRKWWENFVFCGLLVMIGLFIAIKINGNFWWIGSLSGALLGYMLCDFKGLVIAFSRSWKMAKGWRIDWRRVYIVAKSLAIVYISACGFMINSTVAFLIARYFVVVGEKMDIVAYAKMFLFITTSLSAIISLLFFVIMSGKGSKSTIKNALKLSRDLRKLNFFRVYFYLLPKGVFWCIKKTPYAILNIILIALKGIYHGGIFAAKFLKYFFIFIHSEYRMTYATYIFLSVTIGYLTGCNVAIGGVIGGIMGTIGLNVVPKYFPKSKLAPANGHD